MNVTLRDAAVEDLDEVVALNEANVPAVGPVSIDDEPVAKDVALMESRL